MTVLDANNLRAFNHYAESVTLYSSYFGYCIYICISFLPEQWKHCTKWTKLLILLLDISIFYQHSFSGQTRKKELKEKEWQIALLCLFLFCFVLEITWVRKGSRIPLLFFCKNPCAFFLCWKQFWLEQKAWLLQAINIPLSCQGKTLTLYSFTWYFPAWWAHQSSVLRRYLEHYVQMRGQETEGWEQRHSYFSLCTYSTILSGFTCKTQVQRYNY